jgi:hypothetical protein
VTGSGAVDPVGAAGVVAFGSAPSLLVLGSEVTVGSVIGTVSDAAGSGDDGGVTGPGFGAAGEVTGSGCGSGGVTASGSVAVVSAGSGGRVGPSAGGAGVSA